MPMPKPPGQSVMEVFRENWKVLLLFVAFVALLVFVGGCAQTPLRGGRALAGPGIEIAQPQNPAAASEQTRSLTNSVELVLPAGSIIRPRDPVTSSNLPVEILTTRPVTLRQSSGETVGQSIGAAQKDMGREIAARMSAMRPVMWVGIGLLLLSVSMFHPVVFVALGASRSVQMAAAVAGVVMIAAPSVLAGHERLVLFGGLAGVAGYWWVRRYGEKDGERKARGLAEKPPTS